MRPRFLASLLLLLTSATLLQGADQTWDAGSELNGNWSTAANWLGDLVPGSTSVLNSPDVATFSSAIVNGWGSTALNPIVIDAATQNIGGITFTGQAGSYFMGSTGGNTLRLSAGGAIQIDSNLAVSGVVQTVNAPLQLQGITYEFTNNAVDGKGTLVFGGGITGRSGTSALTLGGSNTGANTISGTIANGTATTLRITKSGAGTWVLSGASTYSGATDISAGVLEIRHASALGGASVGTTVASGAALQIRGGITTLAEPLTLNGTGISSGGALRSVAGDNVYAGLVTLASASRLQAEAGSSLLLSHTGTITGSGFGFGLTVGGAGATTIQSIIGTGTGTLTKVDSGTLTLTAMNTFTGRTSVNGGTLVLAFGGVSSNILSSSSPLTLGGGTLQLTGTGTQTVNGLTTSGSTGSRIVLGSSQTLTLGALSSAGAGSGLNINTAQGGNNGSRVGSSVVVLTGLAAGSVINAGFTVTDGGGFGLATVNAASQVIRMTATLLPASGAVAGTHYHINNNGNGSAAAGSRSLVITTSQTAGSITVDTTAASGAVTLDSGVLLGTSLWNFGGGDTSTGTWQISSGSSAGVRAASSGGAMEINNYNTGVITFNAPILAFDAGANAVILKGTGTTVFAGANTYTGATTVRGGTLEIAEGGSINHPSAQLTVAGGPGESAALVLKGGSITTSATTLGSSAGSLGTADVSGGTWINNSGLHIGTSGTGVLTLTGTGSIRSPGGTLGGTVGGLGTANVSGGTWNINSELDVGRFGQGVFNLSGSGAIVGSGVSVGTFAGASGTVNISGGTWNNTGFTIGAGGTGVLNLSGGSLRHSTSTVGSSAGSQGTANVSGGTWTLSSSLTIGAQGTGVLNLTGGTVHVGGTGGTGTVSLGSAAGTGTLNFGTGGGMVGTLNAATITGGSGVALVNFNHTGVFTPAQALTGSLSVNHLASGTTTLNRANTYTGGTIISAGELRVSNTTGSGTGSGPVTLAANSTLSGSGTINAGANAITLNGNLSIGDDNSAAADLALGTTGGSGIVLGSTGSMTFTLFSGAGAGDSTGTVAASDRLVFSGDVTVQPGAKLVLENPAGMTGFALGDQWRLWDFATVGTRLGTFEEINIVGPALDGVNAWSFDTSTGILSIVPEPGRASLLLLGLVAALLRRRCRQPVRS